MPLPTPLWMYFAEKASQLVDMAQVSQTRSNNIYPIEGAICYDPFNFYCVDAGKPAIAARPSAGLQCGSSVCAAPNLCCKNLTQCYDPRTQVCDFDPRGQGSAHLCGFTNRSKAQQVCEFYPYLRPNEFACFDPDTQFCCQVK